MADRSPSPVRGRGRSIGALLLCSFSSSAGTIALTTIVGKFVYDLSGSELDLGLLGLAQFLPAFLLVLVAGTIIDGADRRRVAAAGAIGQAGVVAVLAWYVGTKPTSVVPIFGLVLLFGVGQAFWAPATSHGSSPATPWRDRPASSPGRSSPPSSTPSTCGCPSSPSPPCSSCPPSPSRRPGSDPMSTRIGPRPIRPRRSTGARWRPKRRRKRRASRRRPARPSSVVAA